MLSQAPAFWWRQGDWRTWALAPLSFAYGVVAERLMANAPRKAVGVPVLCVGNFTVGGTGKTPVSIAMVDAARQRGLTPGVLSRGHGGSIASSRIVDPTRDAFEEVGDEPLLIARQAAIAVGRDRAASAALLQLQGCNFLIMDDGFQSARIAIDYALVLVDSERGMGNGRVLPAGPLRAPLVSQMAYADGLAIVGEGHASSQAVEIAAIAGKPVYRASLMPRRPQDVAGRPVLAFAGIGNPEKFFATLKSSGALVRETRRFADHHPYTSADLMGLYTIAISQGLALVTTSKDALRIGPSNAPHGLLDQLHVLEVDAMFEDKAALQIVDETVRQFRIRTNRSNS